MPSPGVGIICTLGALGFHQPCKQLPLVATSTSVARENWLLIWSRLWIHAKRSRFGPSRFRSTYGPVFGSQPALFKSGQKAVSPTNCFLVSTWLVGLVFGQRQEMSVPGFMVRVGKRTPPLELSFVGKRSVGTTAHHSTVGFSISRA